MPPKPAWASMSDKAKGEWVESVFMTKIGALRLSFARPPGDNEPFDFIVCDRSGKPLKVQVKSCWTVAPLGYRIQMHRWSPGRRRPLGFDVLVVYIPPHDVWYVLPAAALPPGRIIYFWPHARRRSRSKWEPFQSKWSILSGDSADDHRLLGITIHAAAGDGKSSNLP